jgi:tRNA(Ile)-lysidine synthetase-like protein
LLPILETYNPAIRAVLAHTAEALAGDHQVLRAEVEAAWERVLSQVPQPVESSPFDKLRARGAAFAVSTPPEPVEGELSDLPFDKLRARGGSALHLDLAAWRDLPLGLQRAVLREAIHTLRASLRNINWAHVERAVWLCREGTTGQRATLAAGLAVEIGYGTLRVGPEAPGHVPATSQVVGTSTLLALTAPGSTSIGGGGRVEIARAGRQALPADLAGGGDPWTAFLDADAAGPELWLRPRQPGDRFQPQGMGGHSMKLNEFMINLKLPKDTRAGWPLLIGRGGIAWVCGLRVAEWAAVRETTRDIWVVSFSPAP